MYQNYIIINALNKKFLQWVGECRAHGNIVYYQFLEMLL